MNELRYNVFTNLRANNCNREGGGTVLTQFRVGLCDEERKQGDGACNTQCTTTWLEEDKACIT